MIRYALRRLLLAVPLFFLISALCFALMHLAPGDPFASISDPRRSMEDRERQRRVAGLDRPLLLQYGSWAAALLQGDLGQSTVTREPVAQMIRARLPATLELIATSLLLSLVVGVGIGILGALYHHSWLDHLLRALSVVGLSMPVFWLAIVSILFFALQLGWLPPGGRATLGIDFSVLDRLRHLLLPACVLALVQVPLWSRYMRASVLEVLQEDHVRTARAKGLGRHSVVLRHVLRPALVPVVTMLGLQVPALFTGTVIIETIFLWPGIGRLFFDGVLSLDYNRLMGILAVSTALILLGNLLADLTHARLDPRIRLGGGS
jgi:peptide/nickel transport system permease protein